MSPLYNYRCRGECGEFDLYLPVKKHARVKPCPKCKKPSDQFIGKSPTFTVYAQDYNGGTIDGYTFKGPKDKADYLKRHGLIEVGDEPPQSLAQIAKNNEIEAQEKRAKELEKQVEDELLKGGGLYK